MKIKYMTLVATSVLLFACAQPQGGLQTEAGFSESPLDASSSNGSHDSPQTSASLLPTALALEEAPLESHPMARGEVISSFQALALGLDWASNDVTWKSCQDAGQSGAQTAELFLCDDNTTRFLAIHAAPFRLEELSEKQLLDLMLVRFNTNPQATNLQMVKKGTGKNVRIEFRIVEDSTGVLVGSFHWRKGSAIAIGAWSSDTSIAMQESLKKSISLISQQDLQIEKNPQQVAKAQAKVWNDLGLIQLAEEQPITALAYFEKANRLDSQEPAYLLNCGFVYQLKSLHGPGTSHFLSQMDLVKKDARLLQVLGEMYESLYDYGNALQYYELSNNMIPGQEEWIINLSDALWGVGQRTQSLEVVRNLLDQKPSARLAAYVAKTLMGLDRYAEAADLLQAAQETFSPTRDMGIALLESLLFLRRHQEALTSAEDYTRLFPENAELWAGLGKANFHLKQFRPAEVALRKSLDIQPTNEDAKSFLAATQSFLGKADTKALQQSIVPAFAKPKNWKELVREDLAATAKSDEFPAILHWQQESLRIQKDMPWVRTEALLVEILKPAGIGLFQEFTYSFLPGYDRLYVNALEVYDSTGNSKAKWNLNQAYVTYMSNSEGGHDAQLAHLPILDLAVGDFIFLQVSRTSIEDIRSVPFTHHRSSSESPIGVDIFQVLGDTREFRAEEYGPVEPTTIPGGIEWRVEEPVVLRNELYVPSYRELAAGVLVSGKQNWQQVGSDYLHLIQHQFKMSIPVREKAFEVRGNRLTNADLIHHVAEWVHNNVRYREVAFGGHSLIPALALSTLNSRQGDCKDQSLLLYEMLKTLDFPAHLALIHLQEEGSIALPTIQQFNHMVVHVPAGKNWPEMWLDPTDRNGSRRPVPLDLEGKVALSLRDSDSSDAVVTPILEGGQEHRSSLDHMVYISSEGHAEFRDSLTLHGKFAAALRAKFLGQDKSKQENSLQAWLIKYIPDAKLGNLRIENLNDFQKPLKIILSYRTDHYFTKQGDQIVGQYPNLWERSFLNLPRSQKRHHPLQIPHEASFDWSLKLRTAPEVKASMIPRGNAAQTFQYLRMDKEPNWKQEKVGISWTTFAVFIEPKAYGNLVGEWEEIIRQTSPTIQVK